MFKRPPPEEFRPNDTLKLKLQRSRGGRETMGGTAGVSSAAVVIWAAKQVGVEIDIVTASVIGGLITQFISAFLRKQVMKP